MKYNLIFVAIMSLGGCKLTDHSEKPVEIDVDLINVPVSGYEKMDPKGLPKFSFDEEIIDVGEISQGTIVTRLFEFENSGGSPLLITDVRSTCGCTVSKDWPTQPIEPGGRGSIEVTFDSEGKSGMQDKPVSIVANTSPETSVVRLKAMVLAPGVNKD